jgi:hypothetical protein
LNTNIARCALPLTLTVLLAVALAACGGAVATVAPTAVGVNTPAATTASTAVAPTLPATPATTSGGGTGTPVAVGATPPSGRASTPVATPTATRGAAGTPVGTPTNLSPECADFIPPPGTVPTPTPGVPAPPALQLAVAHAEVLNFPDYTEDDCLSLLHLRVTVTNRGTATVRVQDGFWLDAGGYVDYHNDRLANDLAERTDERAFTISGFELAPGASETRSMVVSALLGVDRYTLAYTRYDIRRSILASQPLDVSAEVARALAAPPRAIGPRPESTPVPNFQVRLGVSTVKQGLYVIVRGTGFTVPPLRSDQSVSSGAARIAVHAEPLGDTPPRAYSIGFGFNAELDGRFEYDLNTRDLAPGQYTIVVYDIGTRSEVFRGPVLTVTPP